MNILSYVNKPISGAEIKSWIAEHANNNGEYTRIAKSMLKYMNLRDDVLYCVATSPKGTGCGEIKNKPIVAKFTKCLQKVHQ